MKTAAIDPRAAQEQLSDTRHGEVQIADCSGLVSGVLPAPLTRATLSCGAPVAERASRRRAALEARKLHTRIIA